MNLYNSIMYNHIDKNRLHQLRPEVGKTSCQNIRITELNSRSEAEHLLVHYQVVFENFQIKIKYSFGGV
jgi:hypothetical protein